MIIKYVLVIFIYLSKIYPITFIYISAKVIYKIFIQGIFQTYSFN